MLATLVVTTTADSGPGSLRDAIGQANGNSESDEIRFAIPTADPGFIDVNGDGTPDAYRIQPLSELPAIDGNDGVSILGSSQFVADPIGPTIILDGSQTASADGLLLNGDNNFLEGLNIANFDGAGILIRGNFNRVYGNYIGSDATGTLPAGNRGGGVVVVNGINNDIGGVGVGEGNMIAFNGGGNNPHGVLILQGGGNLIVGNSILDNLGLGIDLGDISGQNGVTPNDFNDVDMGANELQNFPELGSFAPGAQTQVTGTLLTAPNDFFDIDFYANSTMDPSGHGEGERYLGSFMVMTDPSGFAQFDVMLPQATNPGEFITATASSSNGSTSEFSLAIAEDIFFSVSTDPTVAETDAAGTPGRANFTIDYSGLLLDGAKASISLGMHFDTTDAADFTNDLDTAVQAAVAGAVGVAWNAPVLTFTGGAGNATSLTFQLELRDDGAVEGDEQFGIDLFNPDPNGGPFSIGIAQQIATTTLLETDTAPIANDDNAQTGINEEIDIFVLANDSDADGDTLSITDIFPGSGTVMPNGTGVTYRPALDFTGTDTFTYIASDGVNADIGTVTVRIVAVNIDPTATDDAFAGDLLANITGNVITDDNGNGPDSDPDVGDTLFVDAVNGDSGNVGVPVGLPSGATLVVQADGSMTVDTSTASVDPGLTVTDTFTYTVNDNNGGSDIATVSVLISGGAVNNDPIAVDDSAITDRDVTVVVDVLANDSDPDGDRLEVLSVTQGSHGTVITDNVNVSYTPDPGFGGLDSFTYTIVDSRGGSATATVTVQVIPANLDPTATDDAFAGELLASITGNVITDDNGNGPDSDPDANDTLFVDLVNGNPDNVGIAVSLTSGAMVTVLADGTMTVDTSTANVSPGSSAVDTFTYTVNDGNGGGGTATVTVVVNAVNLPPFVQPGQEFTVSEFANGGASVGTVAAVDPESQPLAFAIDSIITNGDVGDSTLFAIDAATGELTVNNANGLVLDDVHIVSVIVTDSGSLTDTETATITVVANLPPIATDDQYTINEGTTLVANLLTEDTGNGTDSDADGGVLAVLEINSVAADVGEQVFLASGATVAVNSDGSFTYDGSGIPNLQAPESLVDTFVYTLADGQGGMDTATVSVTVMGANDAPIANDNFARADRDMAVEIDVLDNDFDDDGDTVTITGVGGVSNGNATTDGTTVTYTPNAGFLGSDSFTYTIDDGNGGEAMATVFVEVTNPLHILTTGPDDGDVRVTVDGFGSFGRQVFDAGSDAFYNPVGSLEADGTTFESGVALRLGSDGPRSFLTSGTVGTSGDLANPPIQGDELFATSSFTVGMLRFDLVQQVVELTDAQGNRSGSELMQTYTITNIGTTGVDFELIRYLDGDLDFDGSLIDGGGRFVTSSGGEVLFETDSGGTGATDTTFVGIKADGGIIPVSQRFEIDAYSGLLDRIIDGQPLDELVDGDTNADGFIDDGEEYDVSLALLNRFQLAPGATDTYRTRTVFGSGAPEEFETTGTISGSKWHDVNGNGMRDSQEPGVEGWVIFLDANRNEVLDANERSTVTDANGNYFFADVRPGTYTVAEEVRPGWEQTFPLRTANSTDQIDTGVFVRSVVAKDFNGDGLADLAVANEISDHRTGQSSVTVLFGDQLGGFDSPRETSLGRHARPQALAAADLDGDGDIDLAIAAVGDTLHESSHGNTVLVLLNRGDGSFAAPVPYRAGNGPIDVIAVDLDGDGDLDLAVANVRSHTLSILRNAGNGTFTIAAQLPTQSKPLSVAAGDLDGDGDADLAVANSGSDSVSLYYNLGGGRFDAPQHQATKKGPADVVLAQLNEDNRLDLAVANYASSSVSLLLSQADGSFQRQELKGLPGAVAITAADLNGDGDIDLGVAMAESNKAVSLFFNNGRGEFPDSRELSAGSSPWWITTADTGRGAPLLVVANLIGGISILSTANDGSYQVSISAGEAVENIDFGNRDLSQQANNPPSGPVAQHESPATEFSAFLAPREAAVRVTPSIPAATLFTGAIAAEREAAQPSTNAVISSVSESTLYRRPTLTQLSRRAAEEIYAAPHATGLFPAFANMPLFGVSRVQQSKGQLTAKSSQSRAESETLPSATTLANLFGMHDQDSDRHQQEFARLDASSRSAGWEESSEAMLESIAREVSSGWREEPDRS